METKEILNKFGINQILNLSEKYFDAYSMRIDYENTVEYGHQWQNSKVYSIRNFDLKFVLVLCGALLSIFRSFKYRNKDSKIKVNRIIGVPFSANYFRFKHFPQLFDEGATIFYLPIFHFNYIENHLEYCKQHNYNYYIQRFRVKDILSAIGTYIHYRKRLYNCSKALDEHYGHSDHKFAKIISFTLLYKSNIEGFIPRIEGNYHLWFFDYDIDCKYILLNNYIHRLRPNDKTVHIQHGTFLKYPSLYCNPASDFSLCCSEREKLIILQHNKFNSKVEVLGAPLQSFENMEATIKKSNTFDIVVLMTMVTDVNKEDQIRLLSKIGNSGLKVLIRYRPSSKAYDRSILSPYTQGMTISNGTTLKQDILCSKAVVSFSEDAIFECFINEKKVIFCRTEEYRNIYNFNHHSDNVIICNINELFDIDINKFVENPTNYEQDEFVRYNFGEFNFNRLIANMKTFVKKWQLL